MKRDGLNALSALNEAQRRAVLHTQGPLLVLAGAGSGKTRVITHRVARLLELGHAPESIVAVTFTNKAAGEMRERLKRMVGATAAAALVLGTFHSIGARMLRADPEAFGVPKRFTILDQGDVSGVVRTALRESGVHAAGNDRRFDLTAVCQRISLWKNEFLSYEQARERAKNGNEYDVAAALAFEAYEDRLRSLGAVDFDDLVCHVADRLGQDDELRTRWSDRVRYLLVDEYQDTNQAQFEFLRRLLGEEQNLCVVGDDDQSIYGWRGAKVANILAFPMRFRGAEVIKLEANYRSTPAICAGANAVIRQNTQRFDKTLVPARKSGDPIHVVALHDLEHEAEWISAKLHESVAVRGEPAHHFAVLYRSTRQGKGVEACLQRHGLPYRVLGGQTPYDRKETKDVLAYLKCMIDPGDDLAVRRAIDTPSRGIGKVTIDRLAAFAASHKVGLLEAVHRHAQVEGVGGRQSAALERFSTLVTQATTKAKDEKKVGPALRELMSQVGLRDHVLRDTGSQEATTARWAGVELLFGALDRFEERLNASPFAANQRKRWREWIAGFSGEVSDNAGAEDVAPGMITLATIHSAKGLEWETVFVIGCEEGTMPHPRTEAARVSDAISGDLEEERRLFYVAMTRARDQLWLTRSAIRMVRGAPDKVLPSRFIIELENGAKDSIEFLDLSESSAPSNEELDAMTDAFLASLSLDEPSSQATAQRRPA